MFQICPTTLSLQSKPPRIGCNLLSESMQKGCSYKKNPRKRMLLEFCYLLLNALSVYWQFVLICNNLTRKSSANSTEQKCSLKPTSWNTQRLLWANLNILNCMKYDFNWKGLWSLLKKSCVHFIYAVYLSSYIFSIRTISFDQPPWSKPKNSIWNPTNRGEELVNWWSTTE